MKPKPWFFLGLIGSVFCVAGCGKPNAVETAGHDHTTHAEKEAHTGRGEEGHEDESGGVTFKPGTGLHLSAEVVQALGLITTDAEERPVTSDLRLIAQVYAIRPHVLASARLPLAQAAVLEKATFIKASILRLDRAPLAATGLVDLIAELDAVAIRAIGDFVTLSPANVPAPVLAVPRSAVLDGATGTYVYVVNGDAYLRTPVKIGARSPDHVEITDGLYAGDRVVVTPVNQLWLTELRLTKGGGHSH